LIRELDFLFDQIKHGFWVYPALFVTLGASLYALRARKHLLTELAEILSAPNMRLLVCSLVILFVFSRLFGMGSFWHAVMQKHYVREVKNTVEEGIELLCYCIISFAAVTSELHIKHRTAKSIKEIPTGLLTRGALTQSTE
jgi:hypothetical protein